MQDEELFTKTVIFVNTRPTAEKVYKTLQNRHQTTGALLNSGSVEYKSFKSIEDFKGSATRILIVFNSELNPIDLGSVPFLIHFELPAEKEGFYRQDQQTSGRKRRRNACHYLCYRFGTYAGKKD